jgi:PAS domain-containing protein
MYQNVRRYVGKCPSDGDISSTALPSGCFPALQEHALSDSQVPLEFRNTDVSVETIDHIRPASILVPPPLFAAPSEFEDFFENGAMALQLVGADGIILRANKAELDLLGYEAGEYIGRNIIEFHAAIQSLRISLRGSREAKS